MLNRFTATTPAPCIGLLDIGTSKTVCFIVASHDTRSGTLRRHETTRILGFGCKPSRGLKAGVVIDHDRVEQAVRSAVMQAEQEAGLTIDTVLLAATCGRLQSTIVAAEARVDRRTVGQTHIDNVRSAGGRLAERDGETLLHTNCIAYRLDGKPVPDPLGLAGTLLQADVHAVMIDNAPLHSLLNVVERAGFKVGGLIPAPLASGMGATTAEERQAGVVCIDLGAGATTLSIFSAGNLVAVDAVAVGGQHLTFDIARSLSTPFDQAERIKTLYGTLENADSGDQEMVAYTLLGDEEPTLYQASKARIQAIVSNRLADVLTRVAERIERSGASHLAAHRAVLTGGGSSLPGLSSFAERLLGRRVRVASPLAASDRQPDWCAPPFSAAAGLTQMAFDPLVGVRRAHAANIPDRPGTLGRLGQWLRRDF